MTLTGSVGNFLLMGFKFFAGIIGHSPAMIADAFHSLSDFITDIVVLIFVGISAKPQDSSHDYGHGKFETVASFLIGIGLGAAAVGIIASGAKSFASWLGGTQLEAPGRLALWAALVSIVVKELLYRYTIARGRKLDSTAMIANAWHHRSDALSSIAAAIGIGGALILGERWTILDPLASVIVGAMLVKVAIDLLKGSMAELTDSSLPADTESEIEALITSVPGVSEPHNLRTRRIGNRIAIEAHVRMDGDMSLNEAHEKVSAIENELRGRFGRNTHVIIHMEPLHR